MNLKFIITLVNTLKYFRLAETEGLFKFHKLFHFRRKSDNEASGCFHIGSLCQANFGELKYFR